MSFVDELGFGVSEFTISGMSPSAESDGLLFFPVALDFDTPEAAVTVVAQCPCEFDGDSSQTDVLDLLAYLMLWFNGESAAEFDAESGVTVLDLLAYLDCWFSTEACE